jgi:hypothetical protein
LFALHTGKINVGRNGRQRNEINAEETTLSACSLAYFTKLPTHAALAVQTALRCIARQFVPHEKAQGEFCRLAFRKLEKPQAITATVCSTVCAKR